MFQKFVIAGNLAAEPELRYSPAGAAYARLLVAVDRNWVDEDGHIQQETTWYRVLVGGRQAEQCARSLARGRRIVAEGDRLRAAAYLTHDRRPAALLELTAHNVSFVDAPRQSSAPRQAQLEFDFDYEELPY